MAAILMTSLLGPDAELSWANWLKLLQIPQGVAKNRHEIYTGPFFWPIRHRLFLGSVLSNAYLVLIQNPFFSGDVP